MRALRLFSFFTVLLITASAYSADEPMVIQAEDQGSRADVQKKADEKALGGTYVASERDWNPLINHAIPDSGEEFAVWARFRGVKLCLKAVTDDGQKELKWIYEVPTEWTWKTFGTFSREQLGSGFLIIQSAHGDADAGLDAVILTPARDFDPGKVDELNRHD